MPQNKTTPAQKQVPTSPNTPVKKDSNEKALIKASKMSQSFITKVRNSKSEPQETSFIIDKIRAHLLRRHKDLSLRFARVFGGKWDTWMQVDLAIAIEADLNKTSQYIAEFNIERDKEVWAPTGSCDLWITYKSKMRGAPGRVDIVELKTAYEFMKNGERKEGLVRDRMKEDMEKVAREKKLHPHVAEETEGMEIKSLCVGVTHFAHELTSGDWSSIHGTWDAKDIKYLWVIEPSDITKNDGLAMIWWSPPAVESKGKGMRARL